MCPRLHTRPSLPALWAPFRRPRLFPLKKTPKSLVSTQCPGPPSPQPATLHTAPSPPPAPSAHGRLSDARWPPVVPGPALRAPLLGNWRESAQTLLQNSCLLCREPDSIPELTKGCVRARMAPRERFPRKQTSPLWAGPSAFSTPGTRGLREGSCQKGTVRHGETGSTQPTAPDPAHHAGQGRLLWLWDLPGHLFCFLQVC